MEQKKNELAISTQSEPLELAFKKELKIRSIKSPGQITELINYLYVLLDVKKDNQLNQLEESVLNGVIINNFKSWSINEVKHAFRLAIDGTIKVDLYNKLNAITFGKILVAYKSYKENKLKSYLNRPKQVQEELTGSDKDAIQELYIKNCVIPYLKERKSLKQPKIDWSTYALFKHFWKNKLISLKDNEVIDFKNRAAEHWNKDIKRRRFKGEKIALDLIMPKQTEKMIASCLALFYKHEDLVKNIEVDVKGWRKYC